MFGTKILEERQSKYNGCLRVIRSLGFGTYIQAGGLTQSGGIVETIWRSTLQRVKSERAKVKNVLILGLGGGTIAELIGKKWPEAEITGVDIDPVMIELGKKYLRLGQTEVEIKIGDAYDYITQKSKLKTYDLVIIDLYNGDEYPKKFETENYIQLIRKVLPSDGVAVFNRLYYGDKRPQAVKFGNKLQKVFCNVEWFYPEANLMFVCHK